MGHDGETKPNKKELCPFIICQDPFATKWITCTKCDQAYHQMCVHYEPSHEPFSCGRCSKRTRDKSSSIEPMDAEDTEPESIAHDLHRKTSPRSQSRANHIAGQPLEVEFTPKQRHGKPPLPPWSKVNDQLFSWEYREIASALAVQYGVSTDSDPTVVAIAAADLPRFYNQLCHKNVADPRYKGLKRATYDLSSLCRSPRSLKSMINFSKLFNPEILPEYFSFYEACVGNDIDPPCPGRPGDEWPSGIKKEAQPTLVEKSPQTQPPPKRIRYEHPSPVSEVDDPLDDKQVSATPWEFQILAWAFAAQFGGEVRCSPEWEKRVEEDPERAFAFMLELATVSPTKALSKETYTGSYMDVVSPRPFEKWQQLGRRLTQTSVPFYLAYYRVCLRIGVEPKILL